MAKLKFLPVDFITEKPHPNDSQPSDNKYKQIFRHRSVHLLDLSSSVVIEDPDRLVNGAIAGTIVEVVAGLVEHRLIVRDDTC